MRDDVSVLLLGPVRLTTPAGPVAVDGDDNRTMLARLAMTPGEPVPIHDLIEALWGESFPITAVKTLHSHMARLRHDLRDAGLDGLITTEEAGYRLRIAPAEVDAVRFESLVRQGRRHLNAADIPRAVQAFSEASELWLGNPLEDCRQTPWTQGEVARLREILSSARTNLRDAEQRPTGMTKSFVSRDKDIEEVTWLLANGRMVTLTGVGGVGKSTLATQVAQCNESSYPDGVWFVDLSDLTNFALLAHTVADAIGLRDQSGRHMTTVLAEHLKSRVALLVLDNCEHMTHPCAFFVDTLLHAAPGLRVLVTSKLLLHVEAEQVFDVRPLPVPEPGRADGPAVRLFVDRAAAALPEGFELTADNSKDVVSLCCRLEGVPLALELAAAQLPQLPLPELVARIDSLIRVQPAVRATVDWSYELCSPAERLMWRRMSVFAGGFDLAAVENVCASYNDIPLDTALDVLDSLVSKSMLVRLDGTGPTRYRVPETLRQYGREQLRQAGEQPLVRRRHRNWYLNLAEQRELQWFGSAQPDLSEQTRLDHANLRAALEFCLSEPGEAAAGLRLAAALWFHWIGSGLPAEAQHWLDWALSATRQVTTDRWKALWVNGYVTALQGKTEAARQLLDQVGRYADETSLAHTAYAFGMTALIDGDMSAGAAYLEEALQRQRDLSAPDSNVIMARAALATTAALTGDLARAESLCLEARQMCEATGERWALSYVLLALAIVAVRRGNPSAATSFTCESLRLKDSWHDLPGIAAAISLLAITAVDADRTARLLGIASRIRPHVGPAGWAHIDAVHHRRAELARQAIGDPAFDAAFDHGASLSLPDAVQYALG